MVINAQLVSLVGGKVHSGTSECEYYDVTECPDDKEKCTPRKEVCKDMMTKEKVSVDEAHNHMLCYATWRLIENDTKLDVIKKGCWMNAEAYVHNQFLLIFSLCTMTIVKRKEWLCLFKCM